MITLVFSFSGLCHFIKHAITFKLQFLQAMLNLQLHGGSTVMWICWTDTCSSKVNTWRHLSLPKVSMADNIIAPRSLHTWTNFFPQQSSSSFSFFLSFFFSPQACLQFSCHLVPQCNPQSTSNGLPVDLACSKEKEKKNTVDSSTSDSEDLKILLLPCLRQPTS